MRKHCSPNGLARYGTLVLALCLLLGCAPQAPAQAAFERDPNLNAPGVLPICKETVSLSIGLAMSSVVENFETNYQTLLLEEQGNYDLSFQYYPSGEFKQKVELMVMAGGSDLPDILFGSFNDAQLLSYGQSGAIIPVQDYYENSSYFAKDSLSTIDLDPFPYVTSPDGNLYGLFQLNMSLLNEYEARMFIYEPWVEELGLSMPQTTDELLTVLRAFRDQDPNGNGLADEIPFAGEKGRIIGNSRSLADFLMSSFVYTQSSGDCLYVEDGQIRVAYNTEAWKQGLLYIHNLVTEGLLSSLSFTQDEAQLKALISGETQLVGAMNGTVANYLPAQDERRTEYYVLPPLEGPEGKRTAMWRPSLPVVSMVITKNCKTPEAAFCLGDLMSSREHSVITRWGEEGVDWLQPTEDQHSMFEALGYTALINPVSPWGVVSNKWLAQNGPYIRDYSYGMGMVDSGNPYDTQLKLAETLGDYIACTDKSVVVGKLVYNYEELQEITEIQNNLKTYREEMFTRFIVGDLDIEKNWDAYLAELEKMNLDRFLEISQTAYDRMYGR